MIVQGAIGLQQLLIDGRKTITAFFTEGDIIDLRRNDGRVRFDLVALMDARVQCIRSEMFESILATNPGAAAVFIEMLRDQAHRAIEHVSDLGKKRALEKLAAFILECRTREHGAGSELAETNIPMRRFNLADYMGLRPETVSRCLNRLEGMRLIKVTAPDRIVITNLPMLRQIANGAPFHQSRSRIEVV